MQTFYRTHPHITWTELSQKIAEMTPEQRDQAVTCTHSGLCKVFHVSFCPAITSALGWEKLCPDFELNCEEEVFLTPDELDAFGYTPEDMAEKVEEED